MGLRERKRARTAAGIESVALELFRDKGYAATTVDDIADGAEVSRATVFRYFPSKEEILFAHHPLDAERLGAILGSHRGSGSFGAALRRCIIDFASYLIEDAERLRVRASIIGGDPRLLGRSLMAENEWSQVIAATLGDEDGPTVQQQALAAGATAAARIAIRRWTADGGASGDFEGVLDDALDALRLPKR